MLLAVGLYSCTEDPLFEERARVAEGLPARVMLDFRSEKSCVRPVPRRTLPTRTV